MTWWGWWLLGLLTPALLIVAVLLVAVLLSRSSTLTMGCTRCPDWQRNPASLRAPWWWTENLAWWRHRHSHQHRTRQRGGGMTRWVQVRKPWGEAHEYGCCAAFVNGTICGYPRRADGTCVDGHPAQPADAPTHPIHDLRAAGRVNGGTDG